ncbi:uncharacterized protein MELLADRAFT_93136 [Melampsora larici-populina 98AG31]|uniref:Uncharacterized protein n=1 Tax=Melampsora larici-populina (strain 98AG31 / pathotype 3-4-7) TaxID=747676 RepID=F4S420_MELLP|nr:uncharacterized protein MELLADRAFT_93136 [Melampsora larici-populina 98AG31]EGG00629.1 hypothetical protein MELLADRAFT_93136 [Melampsora larici-populina 98AG31]
MNFRSGDPFASRRGPNLSAQSPIHGFNNHESLGEYPRGFNQRTPMASDPARSLAPNSGRRRDDRSLSPPGLPSGGSWKDRQRTSAHPQEAPPTASSDGRGGTETLASLYRCPMSAPTADVFRSLADQCALDGDFRAYAMAQAEVFGETNRHLAVATTQSLLLKEVSILNGKIDALTNGLEALTTVVRDLGSTPAQVPPQQATAQPSATITNHPNPVIKWVASAELVDILNPLALKIMFSPQVTAYTAIENKQEGYLPHSLFNTIKQKVGKEGAVFAAKHLPPKHQGVESATDSANYTTAIRNAGKHAREKVHNVLLVGIHDAKTREEVDIPVPSFKNLVQRMALRCDTAGDNVQVEDVWRATDNLTRARLAYLRREAARLVLKGGKGSESIWAVIDKQLAKLRLANNNAYETAFFQIIHDEDLEYFDGKTWFKQLKERGVKLHLPSEQAIRARMPGGGPEVQPESSNASSQDAANV